MSLWARAEKGCEDEVLEDEAGGTPRKGGSMGTDPGGEGLPEGSFMQSAIEGDRRALSQPPRTSSHLLALAWTRAQPTSTQMGPGEEGRRDGQAEQPLVRKGMDAQYRLTGV